VGSASFGPSRVRAFSDPFPDPKSAMIGLLITATSRHHSRMAGGGGDKNNGFRVDALEDGHG